MSSSLSDKKCVPCEGGVKPLTENEINNYIKKVPEWDLMSGGNAIKRDYKFKNFAKALQFVNEVALIAEEEQHHPDFEFGWGYCKVTLQTHSIGGLHENDFIVASKINEVS